MFAPRSPKLRLRFTSGATQSRSVQTAQNSQRKAIEVLPGVHNLAINGALADALIIDSCCWHWLCSHFTLSTDAVDCLQPRTSSVVDSKADQIMDLISRRCQGLLWQSGMGDGWEWCGRGDVHPWTRGTPASSGPTAGRATTPRFHATARPASSIPVLGNSSSCLVQPLASQKLRYICTKYS